MHEWDRGIIEAKFHREDTKAILHIPLSRWHVPDAILWLPNKIGVYSVKSSYNTTRTLSREVLGLEESSGQIMGVWSGQSCGNSIYLIKLRCLDERYARIFCQLEKIWFVKELLRMVLVNSINKLLSQCFKFCGNVGWLKMFGLKAKYICRRV